MNFFFLFNANLNGGNGVKLINQTTHRYTNYFIKEDIM